MWHTPQPHEVGLGSVKLEGIRGRGVQGHDASRLCQSDLVKAVRRLRCLQVARADDVGIAFARVHSLGTDGCGCVRADACELGGHLRGTIAAHARVGAGRCVCVCKSGGALGPGLRRIACHADRYAHVYESVEIAACVCRCVCVVCGASRDVDEEAGTELALRDILFS